jgi:sRNA-binding regulator protein Hfq
MEPPHPAQPPGGSDPAANDPRGSAERPQRRMPPPDATGQEADYLARLREARRTVAVQLLDGTVFRGVIEYYDRDMIKVNRLDGGGPNVFVRKKHVRMIWEDPSPSTPI